ncbi:hypothetical protein FXF51_19890 [Nonomuraea sp. PA05]|uniref:hypothetical protein n=1 Tax=Nonomuraea sp. PA05 TaxID=2604466 RepID=UPI0011D3C843|nr:hypothetical protein [Nonomuraea sp. PA05]TYB65467.1 hypothetical protein FXF51_19890 [Nonomuraea sp. PA05]
MAPSNEDFIAFAAAIDKRVTRREIASASLVVRIFPGTDAAEPAAVIEALIRRLHSANGQALVPYAEFGRDTELSQVIKKLANTTPRGWGTLRFPRYRVLSAIRDGVPSHGALQRAFHELHPNLSHLHGNPDQARGLYEVLHALLFFLGGWVVREGFRWSWRRKMRGWFPRYAGWDRADFFAIADEVMRDGDRQKQEGALLRAILCDLDAAFRHRLSPWRRRRRSGFMLFADDKTDSPAKPGRPAPTDRLAKAVGDSGVRRVVVICAPEGKAEKPDQNLGRVANLLGLHPRLAEVEGTTTGTDAEALAGETKIASRLGSPLLAGAEAVGQGLIALGLVAALAIPLFPPLWPSDTSCLAQPQPQGQNLALTVPDAAEAKRLYDQDKQEIEKENSRVQEMEKEGYTVKTVVYLGSGVQSFDHPEYNGVLPELRGIRLAQQKMNEMADTLHHGKRNYNGNVYIRVSIQEAGAQYARAPQLAQTVADQSDRKVLGVVGLGESRKETIEAQAILGEGGLPMLGIGATSENFQNHPLYRQVSWDNPQQARLATAFARNAGIIPTEGGDCGPASSAVILGDPDDDYSKTLSDDFARTFQPSTQLWFSPGSKNTQPVGKTVHSLSALADETCAIVARDPERTLVYWPGRAQRLRDFLQTVKGKNACPSTLTVLTGADITTTVTRAQQLSFDGITLYYAAHALPSHPPNDMGREYLTRYSSVYRHDAWYDHWRGPLAYDALMTMATAINTVCQLNKAAGCGRGSVQVLSSFGVGGDAGLRGATGTIVYPSDPRSASGAVTVVPSDKRFLILRHTPQGPVVSMECGRRDGNDVRATWGRHNEFACPRR